MNEIELLEKRIRLLNADIERDLNLLARANVIAGRLESTRRQRDRAIERLNRLLIEEAAAYPSFLTLEEIDETNLKQTQTAV